MPDPRHPAVDLDGHLPGIGAGDADAFACWLAGAEPALRRALRPFAAACDVEAVLQEALLRVWQVAPRVVPDGRPNALLRLAHTIARHLAISETRRLKLARLDDETLARTADPTPDAPPDPLLRRALLECRERLPGKPAAALDARLAASGGEPDAALARRLGMTLNTFLQNFTRARQLLARCLGKRGVELPGATP